MLTHLPQDVLILICTHTPIEDILALMQTCRAMHALGSLDYVWHRHLARWDVPLDIPQNAPIASLSSNSLREAAVRSLKLDARWRHPLLEVHRAQRIISQNSSFVDGVRLLPGGRWLVTSQYEQVGRTHVTLWSVNDCHPVFKTTVVGRVRFMCAYHHHEPQQISIGVAFARGTTESIRVYSIFLQDDSSTCYPPVFEATPNELCSTGRIAGMNMDGEIMIVVFAHLASFQEHAGQIVCINLTTRVAVAFECPEWSFAWGHLRIFQRHFAIVTSHESPLHTTAYLSFYELPSVIRSHLCYPPPSPPRWPERLIIKSPVIATGSWCSDHPLVFELSGEVPVDNTEACSFTMLGHPIRTEQMNVKKSSIYLLRISFDGSVIERTLTTVPCRAIPSAGEVRVSSSGRRAVWLSPDPHTRECTLMKFALKREVGSESETCISTLMPSFSGLPFNPRDFHSFVFDEVSCKMAVSLPSGELYMLHY